MKYSWMTRRYRLFLGMCDTPEAVSQYCLINDTILYHDIFKLRMYINWVHDLEGPDAETTKE